MYILYNLLTPASYFSIVNENKDVIKDLYVEAKQSVISLEKSMESQENMITFILTQISLEELKWRMGITSRIFENNTELMILNNYSATYHKYDSLVGVECNNLVIEKESWKYVAFAFPHIKTENVDIKGAKLSENISDDYV